jgi:hypothetical protein
MGIWWGVVVWLGMLKLHECLGSWISTCHSPRLDYNAAHRRDISGSLVGVNRTVVPIFLKQREWRRSLPFRPHIGSMVAQMGGRNILGKVAFYQVLSSFELSFANELLTISTLRTPYRKIPIQFNSIMQRSICIPIPTPDCAVNPFNSRKSIPLCNFCYPISLLHESISSMPRAPSYSITNSAGCSESEEWKETG